MTPLSDLHPVAEFSLGGLLAVYQRCPHSGIVEFSLCPRSAAASRVPHRRLSTGTHVDHLPQAWQEGQTAHQPESLIQLKLQGSPEPNGFGLGLTLRGSRDGESLRLTQQEVLRDAAGICIRTHLLHPGGLKLCHVLQWSRDQPFVRVHCEAENPRQNQVTIESFPSVSLGLLSPFDAAEACERLYLHRFRSTWSAEGRHECQLLEDLNLERSWAGYGVRSERWGQRGSMPVRGYFPWGAVEDRPAGVFWGLQLDAPGSWQMELGRRKDKVTLSGGLPDRDFGAWWKTLAPGQRFVTPSATLACVQGDLDDLCHALTRAQRVAADLRPPADQTLPIVYNEWCTSWGEPTHADMQATAEVLAGTPVRIMVIDDGWATKPEGHGIQFNGDWEVDERKFPGGLAPTTRMLREKGFLPGIWFEMEVATRGTKAFDRTDHLLHRLGTPVEVGERRFWDFRKPETVAYLTEKLIDRLRGDGFAYLKVDYNDSLPEGVDGPESPGENLRQHLLGVQAFFRRLREALPDLILENCSSGGHRLEPGFQGLCSMGSFSDAHETLSIPILAANLHRLILPEQSQIWCVLHPGDTPQRMRYGLTATFLGRMALSGNLRSFSPEQTRILHSALHFLPPCTHILRNGKTRLLRELSPSWNAPRGWQAVWRHTPAEALLVLHVFAEPPAEGLTLPLTEGPWQLADQFGEPCEVLLQSGHLRLRGLPPFSGLALRFIHP